MVPSFKTPEYREKEEIVKKDMQDFLDVSRRDDPNGIIKKHVKVVDVAASLWEINKLEERYPAVSRIREERIKKLDENGIDFEEVKPFYEELKIL